MTRALIVHAGNMYGGAERVLETLAQARHLCPSLEPRFALCFEGRLSETLRRLGAPLDMLGGVRITRPHWVLRARRRFAALLRRTSPDVVITQSAWSHVIFAPVVRRSRVPLVMWVHDALSGGPWLERLAGRHQPDLLVCNSLYTQRAARTVFPSAPAELIRCPLVFGDLPQTRQEVRRRYAVPDNAVVFINVARMEPYKGQHSLIAALARLRTDMPWACWIVGGAQRPTEEQYERSLRDAVKALGLQDRVLFLGQQRDVMSLLAAADVFCHPNTGAEPFGLSIVEALQAGLPVVAASLGGPAEIVTESCGRMVPPADPEALAEALSCLLTDRQGRRQMAAAGPARAWELCNPGLRLAELNGVLEQLLLGAAA